MLVIQLLGVVVLELKSLLLHLINVLDQLVNFVLESFELRSQSQIQAHLRGVIHGGHVLVELSSESLRDCALNL